VAGLAQASVINGTLYYTTFSGGTNIHSVDYNYDNGIPSLTLSNTVGITSTAGADGLLFAPDGNLIIAGQNFNQLHEITAGGTAVNTVGAGTGSYHMALSSNASNAILYNLWNGPGSGGSTSISAATLSAGGLSTNGVAYTVGCTALAGCNTDVRSLAYDPNNNTWYYGTAGDGASGTFGTVIFDDTLHTATLTELVSGVYAHGLTFDSFTNDIILSSANIIQQYVPGTGIVSTYTGTTGGDQFDQTAVDGKGHLFAASNGGYLAFVDYSASGFIGDIGNYSSEQFLASSLDDIAPLSGIGSNTVPEPSTVFLLGGGLTSLAFRFRRQKS
jgi:hypothetical protein